MAGTQPADVYFLLVPAKSERAKEVVNYPENNHLLTLSDEGFPALAVRLHPGSSLQTLATIGRNNADIIMPFGYISRIQCSFEMCAESGVIMLWDRSSGQTTHILDAPNKACFKFIFERARRILVSEEMNTHIGFGTTEENMIRFRLEWNFSRTRRPADLFRDIFLSSGGRQNPRTARTEDGSVTIPPSRYETRVHTPGMTLRIRFHPGRSLGSGRFGEVFKATDVDCGRIMAMKVQRPQGLGSGSSKWEYVKREIETLSQISHVRISLFWTTTR